MSGLTAKGAFVALVVLATSHSLVPLDIVCRFGNVGALWDVIDGFGA